MLIAGAGNHQWTMKTRQNCAFLNIFFFSWKNRCSKSSFWKWISFFQRRKEICVWFYHCLSKLKRVVKWEFCWKSSEMTKYMLQIWSIFLCVISKVKKFFNLCFKWNCSGFPSMKSSNIRVRFRESFLDSSPLQKRNSPANVNQGNSRTPADWQNLSCCYAILED